MVSLNKATWRELPIPAQRILLRVSELGAMDRASIHALCLQGERKSAAGRRDLRHSGSRLEVRSALNRIARLVAGRVLVYERAFSLGGRRFYPVRLNGEHPACQVLSRNAAATDVGITAAAVAADLQERLGFVVGRDRETVLAYSGAKCVYSYRCVTCGTNSSGVDDVRCSLADGARCRFAPFVNGQRLVADVGLRVKSDGSMSCAVVWSDDGRSIDEQWAEILPAFRVAQEARVRVVVRPRDGSRFNLDTKQFTVIHPRLERMLALIEAAGGKPTAGVDVAHRHVESLRAAAEEAPLLAQVRAEE